MLKQYNSLIWLVFLVGFTSCDYFDMDAIDPIDAVPAEAAITDATSARAARAGVYDALQDNSFDRHLAGYQYYSDEADWTGTFPTREEFDIYSVQTGNSTLAGMFSSHYYTINVANNILEILPSVEDPTLTDEAFRNSILAEARFGRAFAYLELVLGWGDVPLILTPTRGVGEELNVPKDPASAVYAQIISDLEFAAANLQDDITLGMTKAAANALLARVALYQERWQDAIDYATLAIGEDYDLTSIPYMEDEIWFLKYSSTDGNSLAFFYAPSALNGRLSISPSSELINAFEEGDLRKDATIDTLDGTFYGVKYDDFNASSGSQTDPIRFIRGAEMVLIISEASARLGDFETATEMINMVRNRAGLDDIELNAENFEDAILQERFVELALESGHRLWDVRRMGRALEIFGPGGYDPCDDVWPLPQREIDRNPALEQNGCCNC
ncbi:RagB/SusD family nutrient uptake outer membrane protein [Neolewinella litorea]|uniref:RagB/SusD family nutrient uptake outer membrane protein n=1 Tax=Neolewinella litorea TaxID=2562452 RepID=A0A4S4P040_9BACT|nr:RagB/SusD family nutrient uptake outer membrane protein [Neolewinella litorea]THH41930.1 RagB/SusD family nutrient uptake outer membrane protein [Neolewinella litorea]